MRVADEQHIGSDDNTEQDGPRLTSYILSCQLSPHILNNIFTS